MYTVSHEVRFFFTYFYFELIFTWTAHINSSHTDSATVQFTTLNYSPYLSISFTISTACRKIEKFHLQPHRVCMFLKSLETLQTISIIALHNMSFCNAQWETVIELILSVECYSPWNNFTPLPSILIAILCHQARQLQHSFVHPNSVGRYV